MHLLSRNFKYIRVVSAPFSFGGFIFLFFIEFIDWWRNIFRNPIVSIMFLLNNGEVFVAGEGALYGVDINTGGIADSFANFVWEPAVVKV